MSSGLRRLPALGIALVLVVLGDVAHADDTTGSDFIPRGTQVKGLGTPSGAPEIRPGVYRDTIGPVGDPSGVKYYLVTHTPGSTMYISATARPPKYGDQEPPVRETRRLPAPDETESGPKVAALDSPISTGIASAGGVLVLIGVVLGALFLRRSA